MLNLRLREEVKDYIYNRLNTALEWYKDCRWCEETKENIHKDIESVMKETCDKFDLVFPLPFTFRVTLDEFGICTVTAISRDKN